MPHTLDVRRLAEIFEAIEDDDYRHMTSWECDFFDSIRDQWKAGRALSDKQLEILERIYIKI